MIEKTLGGIVVTAQTFNPSVFSEKWLQDSNLLDLGDLTGGRVFSPELTQFQTETFSVLVIPPKLQVTFDMAEPKQTDMTTTIPRCTGSSLLAPFLLHSRPEPKSPEYDDSGENRSSTCLSEASDRIGLVHRLQDPWIFNLDVPDRRTSRDSGNRLPRNAP